MRITRTMPWRPGKLNEELVAAVPALITIAPDGSRWARFSIEGASPTLALDLPDEVSAAAVNAVLDAHDPDTPSTAEQAVLTRLADWADLRDMADQMVTRANQIETQMGASPSNAQVIAAVRDLAIGARRLTKAVRYLAVREAGA